MSEPDRLARDLPPAKLLLHILIIIGLVLAGPASAQSDATPDAALERLMAEARATMPGACAKAGTDRLIHILCARNIRIGVRSYYPLFSAFQGEIRQGYEIDIAGRIADRLGVDVEFVRVNAATRIAVLAEDRADLTIATMGHNNQRDRQARFIRPHYYQSETILMGPRNLRVGKWADIADRTICVTVGNGSNAQIVSHGARLMLFDEAGVLPERLKDETCSLAAQDDSFFASVVIDPAFDAQYERKFGFAQVPWGMAVARTGSERLAHVLDLLSQIFHRDGIFLESARVNHIATGFLEEQQAVWRRLDCNLASGTTKPACVIPALDTALQPTPFANDVAQFEEWFEQRTGIDLALPMLKTAPAWSLLKAGMLNSLILVVGALVATLGFALAMGAALGARMNLVRWPARVLTVILQSSPIVLTLVISAAVAHALVPYSAPTALGAAIAALGLANGSNAGQAISEAMSSLRIEEALSPPRSSHLFAHAVGRSATQIVAFLINAAKGTPIASFIGAPELLSSLTDITSFSSGRATTYTLLLIYYVVLVMIVVWLCGRLRGALAQRLVHL